MRKVLIAAAVSLLAAVWLVGLRAGHAAARRPAASPRGHPYLIAGSVAQGAISLRFVVVDGRRILVDARTLQPVYRLRP